MVGTLFRATPRHLLHTAMRTVLVTTGPNAVLQALDSLPELTVIDAQQPFNDCIKAIRQAQPGILITYRCPHIIPMSIIRDTALAVNIHPSMLPKYAGLNPWHDMMRQNETRGGVTIHRLTEKVDSGEIICQREMTLDFSKGMQRNRDNADTLAAEMIAGIMRRWGDQSQSAVGKEMT